MQILYLLVLGDKSNILYGKDLCFNANYRFTHEFIDGDEDKVKVSWEIKDILPDNFFTTRENNKNCCIDNVSEIIGINGSGKTLILKTLFRIANNNFEENYILIYKKDEKLIGRYGLIIEKGNRRVYEMDCSIDNTCYFSTYNNIKKRIDINNDGLDPETDLVYLCNHYCFTWENLNILKQPRLFDYSTAGLINSDYINSKITHDGTSRICLNSHQYKEMERIIYLLSYLQKNNEKYNTIKSKADNYSELIKSIIIKCIKINYNKDIIVNAHDAALKLAYHFKNYNNPNKNDELFYKKVSNQYSTISSALAINRVSQTKDFFFLMFLSYIASRVAEHIHFLSKEKEPQKHLRPKLNTYCSLVKRIKSKLNKHIGDISDYRNEILNLIIKLETNKEVNLFELYSDFNKKVFQTNENIYNFFNEFDRQLNDSSQIFNIKKDDENVWLEFDIRKKESINILYKIIELYFKAQGQYPFIDFGFDPSISSGELSFFTLWGRLYDYLEKNEKTEHAVIFIDEAETTLHPELQKALCQSTISFVEDYCKYKKRKLHLHIIFASHSPMLMSDVPTGNIVFLSKDNSVEDLNKTDWKTFSGDIFEIYQKGFFLKNGSIGNFSVAKVDDVIQHISQGNISDEDRKIIDMIGDGLISNYFQRIIDNQSSSLKKNQK